ncbi:hypothetical protein [Atlantibacter hermannii]|uniref:hypothetical protein n=1 Tax=Atlantibacter hermannii TaxID=565 RepID=UPI0028AD5705|nr:hypothetical protein [Atlantibacter hermannii]
MSKIERYAGNLRAFGSSAQGLERTLFGETTQADDLTSQVTAAFLRGWGIVGPSENPSLEDFNAAMYAMSQFIAYQHQMGIPEWDAAQEYYTGSLCVRGGETYSSLVDDNIGSAPPSAKWTPVLTSKNGLANLGLGTGLTGIIGQSRNAAMRITAASSTATWTADELVVETAIGGTQYRLNNLSLSINLATTGAGGMDTGAAPASGFVAIYAIYNPTTKTTAALAVNVTSAKAPEVYGGSNMPAGYTASALIAVCGTNSSGQLLPGLLTDRTWMTPRTIVLNVTVQNSSWTSMTLAAMVPLNAKRVMGDLAGATNSGNITMGGAGDSTNAIGASWPTYYLIGQCPFDVELSSPQTMYYLNTMPSGSTISFQVFVKGYVF